MLDFIRNALKAPSVHRVLHNLAKETYLKCTFLFLMVVHLFCVALPFSSIFKSYLIVWTVFASDFSLAVSEIVPTLRITGWFTVANCICSLTFEESYWAVKHPKHIAFLREQEESHWKLHRPWTSTFLPSKLLSESLAVVCLNIMSKSSHFLRLIWFPPQQLW